MGTTPKITISAIKADITPIKALKLSYTVEVISSRKRAAVCDIKEDSLVVANKAKKAKKTKKAGKVKKGAKDRIRK